MSVEAPEQVTNSELADTMAEFLTELNGQTPADGEVTPPPAGAGEEVADEAIDETAGSEEVETEDTPVETPKAPEGPSAEMRQIAKLSGVSERLIARAQNNEQLQLLIEAADELRAEAEPEPGDKDAPAKDELAWDVELPEDEFPADDPVRKQFTLLRDKLQAQQKANERVLHALVKHAQSQLDQSESQMREKLQSPFDRTLDSYSSDVLGKSDGIKAGTPQSQLREMLWQKAWALGVTPQSPAEEIERLTHLAVEAVRKDLADQRKKTQRRVKQQPRETLGGSTNGRLVEKPKTFEELLGDLREGQLNPADI